MVNVTQRVLDVDELVGVQEELDAVLGAAIASRECELALLQLPGSCDPSLDLGAVNATLREAAGRIPYVAIRPSGSRQLAFSDRDVYAAARLLRRDPLALARTLRQDMDASVAAANVTVRIPGGVVHVWSLYTVNATARAGLGGLALPVRVPKPEARDISELHIDSEFILLEPDPLVLWSVGRLETGATAELHYTSKRYLCRSAADCPSGSVCDGIDPVGVCASECHGCGSACDSGRAGAEVCDGGGRCLASSELGADGSACACGGVCASGNCAQGLCCPRGAFSDPARRACSAEPVVLSLPSERAELVLDQPLRVPLLVTNPTEFIQSLRLEARGPFALELERRDFLLAPGESASSVLTVTGARVGSGSLVIDATNEGGTLGTQRALTISASAPTTPMGVEVVTAPDIGGAGVALALALASSALALRPRR